MVVRFHSKRGSAAGTLKRCSHMSLWENFPPKPLCLESAKRTDIPKSALTCHNKAKNRREVGKKPIWLF